MSKIIWIDLWTTNSCFAYMLGEKPEVIPNNEWHRTTPSVVYIKWDQMLVWEMAKRKAVLEPKNVVYEVKRFIWRKFTEVKEEMKQVPYDIKEWSDGWVIILVDDREYKPEQISGFILKKIKEDAEKYLNDKVESAVITVPAYFNDSQRNATKAAGEIAWLKVDRIINEPTAAALAYGLEQKKDEKIAIFDFGGWTFDITLLEIWSEWTFQVLATSWDTHLWWADIDKLIIDWLVDWFKTKEWIDLHGNAMAMQRLKEESEKAKIWLSQSEQVEINIPFIMTWTDWQPKHIQQNLTRAQYEKMIWNIVERTVKPVMDALKDSKLSPTDINEVLLVGWSTRIPLVRKRVFEIFKKEPKMTINPDEAVALWAGVQWGILKWDVKDILLLDVTPLSLWVEVEWRIVDVVIPRNTTVPVRKSKVYTTAQDNQPAVTIHVLQWERPMAVDNKSLWQFNLEGIPPMRRWEAQIEVIFDIDANGILHVSAIEKTTGKQQKVTIQWATNLSDEEIQKAQKEAEKFAESDKKNKQTIESKNNLEATAYSVEKMIQENKDKLDDSDKTNLNKLIEDAHKIKENPSSTKEEAEAKMKELQDALTPIYQKMQQATWQPTSQWPQDWWTTQVTDAEVVDADDKK